jgi:hypothetical protein
MANRNNHVQSLHDRVIKAAEANFNNWTVYTNPGQQKNASIGNAYPDIILTNKITNNIEFVIEVETSDSVTAHEAFGQWKQYANLPGTFYLLVPRESEHNAVFFCAKYDVQARFGIYWLDAYDRIQISYE